MAIVIYETDDSNLEELEDSAFDGVDFDLTLEPRPPDCPGCGFPMAQPMLTFCATAHSDKMCRWDTAAGHWVIGNNTRVTDHDGGNQALNRDTAPFQSYLTCLNCDAFVARFGDTPIGIITVPLEVYPGPIPLGDDVDKMVREIGTANLVTLIRAYDAYKAAHRYYSAKRLLSVVDFAYTNDFQTIVAGSMPVPPELPS